MVLYHMNCTVLTGLYGRRKGPLSPGSVRVFSSVFVREIELYGDELCHGVAAPSFNAVQPYEWLYGFAGRAL